MEDVPVTGVSEGKVVYGTWGATDKREIENWSLLAFQKNYSDLKVDLVWAATASEYLSKLISLLSGGTPPDVVRLPAWSATTFYYEDAVRRLDPYIRRDSFKTDHLAQPSDVVTYQRRWYAFPRGQSAAWGIFYNRRLLEQAGVKPPATNWTWDDFVKTAVAVTRPGSNQWGTALEPMADFYYPWVWGNGGGDFERTAEKSTIAEPVAVEALQWLADLRHKLKVAPPAGQLADPLQAFGGGKLGLLFGPGGLELELARFKGLDFGLATQPRGKSVQTAAYMPDVMAMTTVSQHTDDAWEMMQFLVDVEMQRQEFDNGLWMPQSKAIVGAESYQKPPGSPYDRRPGIPGALTRARTPILLPRGDEIRAATLKELAPVWQGTANVKTAADAAATRVNVILNGAS